jgi:hypothetical protein
MGFVNSTDSCRKMLGSGVGFQPPSDYEEPGLRLDIHCLPKPSRYESYTFTATALTCESLRAVAAAWLAGRIK